MRQKSCQQGPSLPPRGWVCWQDVHPTDWGVSPSARGLKVAGMPLVRLGPVVLPATAPCEGRPPATERPEPADPAGARPRAAVTPRVLTEAACWVPVPRRTGAVLPLLPGRTLVNPLRVCAVLEGRLAIGDCPTPCLLCKPTRVSFCHTRPNPLPLWLVLQMRRAKDVPLPCFPLILSWVGWGRAGGRSGWGGVWEKLGHSPSPGLDAWILPLQS